MEGINMISQGRRVSWVGSLRSTYRDLSVTSMTNPTNPTNRGILNEHHA